MIRLVTIGIEHKDAVFNHRGQEIVAPQGFPIDHTKNMLKSFKFTSLPKAMDEKTLKKMLSGYVLSQYCKAHLS